MKKVGLIGLILLVSLILIAGFGFLGVAAMNRWNLELTLEGPREITLEVGKPYQEYGAFAHGEGTLLYYEQGNPEVEITGEVDTETLGTYEVEYRTEWKRLSAEDKRVIHVVDTQAPVITLQSVEDSYTLPGQPYQEEGFQASDNYDGDLTSQVKVEERGGVVYYEVEDSSGNKANAERFIVYDDRDAPVLTLEGGDITLPYGTPYEEPGYSAEDNVDGDLTASVEVSGEVDVYHDGDYTITYTVKDAYNNETEATRKVTVEPKPEPVIPDHTGEKVVYLTFDDGPGKYTEQLLEILDKYDVKVTFFVTNQFPQYQYLIAKEAEAGHAVGVHTYSHVFSEVYASDEAYWNDFERMNDIIEEQTGQRTTIFRFPGGSSNKKSLNYNIGIMTRLTQQAEEKGYTYFDWNVLSGDAGETTDSDQIVANIMAGIRARDQSVVLCHDIHDYTVNAMDEFLKTALEEGFVFEILMPGGYTVHGHLNN